MVKEELYEKVVEVRRLRDRVTTLVVVFEEDVLRLICGNAPQIDEAWKPSTLYMMSRNVSGICILQVI